MAFRIRQEIITWDKVSSFFGAKCRQKGPGN